MSVSEWEKVASKLGKIERCAWWINHYADEILHAVELTPSLPPFVTRAESDLHEAHTKLIEAQQKLLDKARKD